MKIILNGKETDVAEGTVTMDMIDSLGYPDNATAVWLNGRQLLAAEYNALPLGEGDELKIVRLIGGG